MASDVDDESVPAHAAPSVIAHVGDIINCSGPLAQLVRAEDLTEEP